jgi:AbrB family looped-hinge helix DNA binding protein
MIVTMNSAGRLVIPKQVRVEAGLLPGVPLEIRCRDGLILIEPAVLKVKRIKKGRVAVAVPAEATQALSTDTVRRKQKHLRTGSLGLFGKVEFDPKYDYKQQRRRP